MKINEIVEFSEFIDIMESLNTKFDHISWSMIGQVALGIGQIDDNIYEIRMEPGAIPIGNRSYRFMNIAFSLMIDNQSTTTFQNKSHNSSRVFGAISNAINDELPKIIKANSVDFLVFAAKNDFDTDGNIIKTADRKIKSYTAMVRSNLHGLSNWSAVLGNLKLKDGAEAIIAMRRKPTPIEWQTIQNYFINKGKSIDYMEQKK